MPTRQQISMEFPNSISCLEAMASRGLIRLGGDDNAPESEVTWRPFAKVLLGQLGRMFKHLRENDPNQSLTLKYVKNRFRIWKVEPASTPEPDRFKECQDVSAISKREADEFDADRTKLAPYDPFQFSTILETYWNSAGYTDERIQEIHEAVFEGFGVPSTDSGSRPLGYFLRCFDHLIGSSNHNFERRDRIGLAAHIARNIGNQLEKIPKSRRRQPRDIGQRNPQIPGDQMSDNLHKQKIAESFCTDVYISEENKHQWRLTSNGRMIERLENDQWQPLELGEYIWLVDPLDGSLLYETGMFYAISIAIGQCVDTPEGPKIEWFGGVVCLPKTRELMVALVNGGGLYLDYNNHRVAPLRTSGETVLDYSKGATHLTGQPAFRELMKRFINQNLPRMGKLFERVVMLGCGAMQMAYVSSGQLDSFVNLKSGGPWDYLGPALLVEAAGGVARNCLDKCLDLRDRGVVVAGTNELYQNLRKYNDLDEFNESDFDKPQNS